MGKHTGSLSQVTGWQVWQWGLLDTYRGDGSLERASDAPEVTQLEGEPSKQGKAGRGLFLGRNALFPEAKTGPAGTPPWEVGSPDQAPQELWSLLFGWNEE